MAYSQPFLRLVASGSLYTVEGWSWSLALVPDFDNTPEPIETIPTAVVNAVSAFHGASGVSTQAAKLELLKLNLIGTDGRYVDQTDSVFHEYTTPVPGSSASGTPAQIAIAVTLRTGARRGLASNGRFYVPAPPAGVSTDGRIPESAANNIATAATTMLDALNAALPGYRVGVVSAVGAGLQKVVTHVSVGRVPDTIRSRRKSITEMHVDGGPLAGP